MQDMGGGRRCLVGWYGWMRAVVWEVGICGGGEKFRACLLPPHFPPPPLEKKLCY